MNATMTMPMLETYPAEINMDRKQLAEAIDAIIACQQACTACADACLSEPSAADLTKCVRTNLDCADICAATARVLSRHTGYDANISRAQLQACVTACQSCAAECGQHSQMRHCEVCAEACRRCEQACTALLSAMS